MTLFTQLPVEIATYTSGTDIAHTFRNKQIQLLGKCKMTRTKRTYLAVVVFFLSPMAAKADIIDLGGSVLDESTGIEWLALDIVSPCSTADLVAESSGCEFFADGYSLADSSSVETLLANAGIFGTTDDPVLVAQGLALIFALGPTIVIVDGSDPDFLVTEIWGATSTGLPGTPDTRYVSFFDTDNPLKTDYLLVGGGHFDPVFEPNSVVVSHWLQRDYIPVPEPSTMALLGIGLAGMGMARRRRKV